MTIEEMMERTFFELEKSLPYKDKCDIKDALALWRKIHNYISENPNMEQASNSFRSLCAVFLTVGDCVGTTTIVDGPTKEMYVIISHHDQQLLINCLLTFGFISGLLINPSINGKANL